MTGTRGMIGKVVEGRNQGHLSDEAGEWFSDDTANAEAAMQARCTPIPTNKQGGRHSQAPRGGGKNKCPGRTW